MSQYKLFEELETAERYLAKWQKLLRLQDWDIHIYIKRAQDFHISESQGEVTWNLPRKEAIIRLLDPIDYGERDWSQDHEVTLVHELLHLHFAHHREPVTEDEQAIAAISKALVTLEREGNLK